MKPEQVAELRVLQARARTGALSAEEHERYLDARRRLEQALTQAQLLLAPATARARRGFRVVCALEVELSLGGPTERTLTSNFSAGGFSAAVGTEPVRGSPVPFALWLPGDTEPMRGEAVCRGARKLKDRWRASFEFLDLDPEVRARLELEVVDMELEMLWPSGRLDP